jgi:hypothetical protein
VCLQGFRLRSIPSPSIELISFRQETKPRGGRPARPSMLRTQQPGNNVEAKTRLHNQAGIAM